MNEKDNWLICLLGKCFVRVTRLSSAAIDIFLSGKEEFSVTHFKVVCEIGMFFCFFLNLDGDLWMIKRKLSKDAFLVQHLASFTKLHKKRKN